MKNLLQHIEDKRGKSHTARGKEIMIGIVIFLIVALFALNLAPTILNEANNTSQYSGVPVWQYTMVGLLIIGGFLIYLFKFYD